MIFKQWELVISGKKTQTRRMAHDGDTAEITMIGKVRTGIKDSKGRWRFWLGQCLPVIPKRGKPGVWVNAEGKARLDAIEYVHDTEHDFDNRIDRKSWLVGMHWRPARVEITEIRREYLQSITEADAIAEGVSSVEEYKALWESINGKTKGARWDDNPLVTVLVFKNVPMPWTVLL